MGVRDRLNPSTTVALAVGLLAVPAILHAAFLLYPGLASFVVVSPSMEPAVESGSVVFVVEADEYATGDVVTYSDGREFVTHRIVDRTDLGYVTRGDANDEDDGVVPEDAIVGKVVFSLPLYGRLLRAGASRYGYLFFVAVPALLIVGHEIRRIVRALR